MTSKIWTSGSAFLLTLALSPFAWSLTGGAHGGGGNGLHSTPQEVLKEAQNFNPVILMEQIRDGLTGSSILPIQDVRAKAILTKIMALKNVVDCPPYPPGIDYVPCRTALTTQKPNPILVKMHGACVEYGQDRDASVTFHYDNKGEAVMDQICLSAERLAVYPMTELGRQLEALIIHEFSHVAGYDEQDAIYIQKYVISKLLATCQVTVGFDNDANNADDEIEIQIDRGNIADVSHTRSFGTVAMGSHITLVDRNNYDARGMFQIHWAADGSGTMRFNTLEVDGTSATHNLAWGPVTSSDRNLFPNELFSTNILSSDMSFGGKPLKVDAINIDLLGCQR